MKRLFVLTQLFEEKKGSYYAFVEELANYTKKQGYDVKILCRRKKNQPRLEKKKYAEIIRFPLLPLPVFGGLLTELLFGWQTSRYFKKNKLKKNDIIVVNGYCALGILNKKYFLRTPDQPVFTYLKNMALAKNQISLFSRLGRKLHFLSLYPFDKLVVENATGLICSSMANKKENEKYYKITVPSFIPNKAVDIKELNKGKISKLSGRNLLFISRANEKVRKGAVYFENILPSLFKKYPDLKLIHLGEKFEWNIPKKYLNRIKSLGKIKRSEMKKYYKGVNLLVLNSLNEGIPAVLVEAMAIGTNIISSNIEGIDEYLPKELIYERANEKELMKKICFVLDNQKKVEKYKQVIKKKVMKLDMKIYYYNLLHFLEKKDKNKNLLM